jgi:hypothetical protein
MPLQITTTAAGTGYGNPMVGAPGPFKHVKVDLSGLTSDEVDADGYLKPGVVLKESGGLAVLVGAAAGIIYVVTEPTKLAVTVPADTTSLGSETGDHLIAVSISGLVNRDIAEDNMGRAYTANELTSFATLGTHLAVTST